MFVRYCHCENNGSISLLAFSLVTAIVFKMNSNAGESLSAFLFIEFSDICPSDDVLCLIAIKRPGDNLA